MVAAVAKLIRNAPRASLEAFLTAERCPLGDRLRAMGPGEDYPGPLLRAVDELNDEDHARLTVDADRITEMATEFGQTALLSVVRDRLLVEELENAYARSLWTFLNEPDSFRRAEEIRYTDQRRQGRMWSGYQGPPGTVLKTSETALEAFKRAAVKLVGSIDAQCEVYRRTRPNFGAPESELWQLTLYHDDLPTTFLEFRDRRLVQRNRRPVVELSVTYEPATGAVEVIAPAGELRDGLARLFADTLLGQEIDAERITLRRYDLSRLLRPFEFPFDPEDGMHSVKVVLLRLQRVSTEGCRTILECSRRADGTVWDQAREELTHGDDLVGAGYLVTQVRLSIKFLPGPGNRRGKTLPVTITLLNGCDLKSRTERERLIGEKYLRRWGLIVEV